MKPPDPFVAARRAKSLMARFPRCSSCGGSDFMFNDHGDRTCAPCLKATLAEREAAIRRRMK